MIDWLKKMFSKDAIKSAAETKYYIEKYKDFDKVIKTYYQAKDHNGKLVNIDGIVNPLKIDNRQQWSVIDDQGTTSECTCYSICGICEALIWKRTGKLINLDAHQVYALAKQLDGDINSEGTYLEYAIKAAMKLGGLEEISKNIKMGFLYNDNSDAMIEQLKYLLHKYEFIHAGFSINEGWMNLNNNNYTIKDYGRSYGGHAVAIVGADTEHCYIANSWGKTWAAKGFALMPWNVFKSQFLYACFLQNCFDNWHE